MTNFRNATRQVIRQAQRYLRDQNRLYGHQMEPVPPAEWPSPTDRNCNPVMGCWRSSRFLAVAYGEQLPVLRLTVQRTLLQDDGQWADGITWDELQAVKNECGFSNRDAVEVYPANADLVNVANMRHLWILQDPFALTWRADRELTGDAATAAVTRAFETMTRKTAGGA